MHHGLKIELGVGGIQATMGRNRRLLVEGVDTNSLDRYRDVLVATARLESVSKSFVPPPASSDEEKQRSPAQQAEFLFALGLLAYIVVSSTLSLEGQKKMELAVGK